MKKTPTIGLCLCMLVLAPLTCTTALAQIEEQTTLGINVYTEQTLNGVTLYLQVDNNGDTLARGITTNYILGPAPFQSDNSHWDGFQYIFFHQSTFCRFLDEGRSFLLYVFLTSPEANGEFLLKATTQAYNAESVTLLAHISIHGNTVNILRIN